MKTMEDMLKELKELVAQGQPAAPAAATPATQDSELMQRIQDLEEDKVKMAEQLAEVRALVEKQDQVAATQKARYDRSSRLLAEASLEDKETMWKQQLEIRELQAKLQQQQEQSVVVDVATQIVHETTPSAEISEATQQQPVTRWDPNTFHTPSQQERTEERQRQVEKVLRSLGRSPKEKKKYSRNKANRQRQRDFADRQGRRRRWLQSPVYSIRIRRKRTGSLRSRWSTLEGVRQGRPAASGCRTESRG